MPLIKKRETEKYLDWVVRKCHDVLDKCQEHIVVYYNYDGKGVTGYGATHQRRSFPGYSALTDYLKLHGFKAEEFIAAEGRRQEHGFYMDDRVPISIQWEEDRCKERYLKWLLQKCHAMLEDKKIVLGILYGAEDTVTIEGVRRKERKRPHFPSFREICNFVKIWGFKYVPTQGLPERQKNEWGKIFWPSEDPNIMLIVIEATYTENYDPSYGHVLREVSDVP